MSLATKCAFTGIESFFSKSPLPRTTFTCSSLDSCLQQCQNLKCFNQILCQMICTGLINDTYAASRILKFSTGPTYIDIDYSHKIFNNIKTSNGFIWNTMLRAYAQRKRVEDALFMYKTMLKNDCALCVDNYTYPILIQGCSVDCLEFEGRELHGHLVKMGFENDVYVVNNLINLYSVCDKIGDAREVFDKSLVLDLVSWNTMLAGYVLTENIEEAMSFYKRMPKKNVIASNSMIVLLGKSGMVSEAHQLFDELEEKDSISWTALISCYEQNGLYSEALNLFVNMCCTGFSVDEVVIVTVLSACAHLLSVRMGKTFHALALRIGLGSYVNLQNALINMYSRCGDVLEGQKLFNSGCVLDMISWNSMVFGYIKCGFIEKARELFDSIPERDVISWSTMISGYTHLGKFSETITLFHDMQRSGVKPDEITLVSVVSACTHLAALDQGKWLDAYIRRNGMRVNTILGTTLIDMYMKCGCLENAVDVFCGMKEPGISSWNALILGYATNGLAEKSLEVFEEMKKCGIVPNEITFVAVLGACRHMGLVEEGRWYFDSMGKIYNIEPNIKHYGCLVDLLARTGLLKEAEKVIDTMPMAPDIATWGALLGACKKYGDKGMGERIGRKLIELQPEHDGFHVLLSNIYASKGDWIDVREIRGTMMQQGVLKTPGCSMIETNGVVHEFLVGDKLHPRINEIEEVLNEMVQRMRIQGCTIGADEVLLSIDEEERETNLSISGW